jgi:hypothetical protein
VTKVPPLAFDGPRSTSVAREAGESCDVQVAMMNQVPASWRVLVTGDNPRVFAPTRNAPHARTMRANRRYWPSHAAEASRAADCRANGTG